MALDRCWLILCEGLRRCRFYAIANGILDVHRFLLPSTLYISPTFECFFIASTSSLGTETSLTLSTCERTMVRRRLELETSSTPSGSRIFCTFNSALSFVIIPFCLPILIDVFPPDDDDDENSMKRVEANAEWALMCPSECPGLSDVYGDEFEALYEKYEREGKFLKMIPAQKLWYAILESQTETGGPFMLYKVRPPLFFSSSYSRLGIRLGFVCRLS